MTDKNELKRCLKKYKEQKIVCFTADGINTEIKNGEEKKKPYGLPQGHHRIFINNCENFWNGAVLCVGTGKRSNLTIIDIDNKETYFKILEECPEIKNCKTVETLKGYHLYFKYNPNFTNNSNSFIDLKHVDVRNDGGFVFAPPTKYKLTDGSFATYNDLGGNIVDIPQYFTKKIKNKEKKIENKSNINVVENIDVRDEFLEAVERSDKEKNMKQTMKMIENGLLDHKCDDYSDWVNVGLAIYNACEDLETFKQFSKRCQGKYDEGECEAKWKTFKNKKNGVGMGSIIHWSKEKIKQEDLKNIEEEEEEGPQFVGNFIDIETLESPIKTGEFIENRIKNKMVFCNDTWYIFNIKNKLWTNNLKNTHCIVSTIREFIDEAIKFCEEKIKKNEKKEYYESQIKLYKKQFIKVDHSGYTNQIGNHLCTILNDSTFASRLDSKKYVLVFKNGILDLKTGKFREGLFYDDMVSKCIPFDYSISSIDDINTISNIFFKICNANIEHSRYYSSVLGYALTGDAEMEKAIWFLVGQKGNNGKTTILDALNCIMPNYVVKIDNKAFYEDENSVHKYVASMKGARIVYVEENIDGKHLAADFLKKISEGRNINYKVMYGTTDDMITTFKVLIVSNNTPTFKTDGGIENRYRQCQFNSHFDSKNTVDDYKNLEFVQDKSLPSKLKEELAMAMINYLIAFSMNYSETKSLLPMPDEWKDITNETLYGNNNINELLEEKFEFGKDFRLQKDEIKSLLKSYNITESKFKDALVIKNIHYSRTLRKNNKKGVWIGIKLKEEIIFEE